MRIRLDSENIDVTEKGSKKEDRRFRLDCDDTSINGTQESTLWVALHSLQLVRPPHRFVWPMKAPEIKQKMCSIKTPSLSLPLSCIWPWHVTSNRHLSEDYTGWKL